LDTVRDFISAAHIAGMAAMPYLAVYAASLPFWSAHPKWALYDGDGRPSSFLDFLGLMDPSPGSAWIIHLLDQCRQVLAALPFDGFHVDQYGDPKEGWTAGGAEVDIPAAFTAFIVTLKEAQWAGIPAPAVVFNAVGNWPIEALAQSPQDFNYIEIWPPDVYYKDLRCIVSEARQLSDGKPVTIALYLAADLVQNVRLANALIFALGGSRIELGEAGRLLADPYFPKHQAIGPELRRILRNSYDFAIRYGELIGPAAADEPHRTITTQPGIWTTGRSCPGWLAVNLVNMSGLGEPRWDEPLSEPFVHNSLAVRITCPEPVDQVWWASPDRDEIDLEPLAFRAGGGEISVTLPELKYWILIAIKLTNQMEPIDVASGEMSQDMNEPRSFHD
jgi:dextranase